MASIQRLKNGWRYRVSFKEHGKYKTKTQGGFRTKKEAEIAAAELEKKLHVGHDITAGDQLFAEYIRTWFELYKKDKYSVSHENNVELSVRLVEKHFVGVKMKELNRDMYQKFLNSISPNYATETVKKRHTYIKECLKNAIEDEVITKDPTYKAVIKGKKDEKIEELKYLNYEEVRKLLHEVKKDMRIKFMSRYIILCAIATGARYSEIIGLTWDCVDFDNKSVNINKSWDYKSKHDFMDTKTFKSKRIITIDDDTCNVLKDLKIKQKEHELKTGLRNTKNLCFINSSMKLVTNEAVNKTLKSLCKKCDIKVVTCHSLRHTHASILLYRGVNVKYLSRRLGHKDIVITLQTYSHILDEMEQKESRQVDTTMKDLYQSL